MADERPEQDEQDEKEKKVSAADKSIGTIPKDVLPKVKTLCERLGKSLLGLYEHETKERDARFNLVSQIMALWPKCTQSGLAKLVLASVGDAASKAFRSFTGPALARLMLLAGGPVNTKTKARAGVKVKDFTLNEVAFKSDPAGIAAALKVASEKQVVATLRKVKAIASAKGRAARTPEGQADATQTVPHTGTDHEKFFERVRNSLVNYAAGNYGFSTTWLSEVRTIMEAATKLYTAIQEVRQNAEKKAKKAA